RLFCGQGRPRARHGVGRDPEPKRDNRLRSADFLEVTTYPHITFRRTQIDRLGLHRYRVAGDVTIRNETRPLSFQIEASPAITDPWGNRRAAAAATGVLDRKNFGLTYNQVLEFGGLAIGEDVRLPSNLRPWRRPQRRDRRSRRVADPSLT